MSAMVDAAVMSLNAKMQGKGFDGTAKFVMTGEGAVMIDASGARAADEEADVTLTATPEVFKAIMDGEMNATAAFMTGKLSLDGSMVKAMALASLIG